MSLGSWHQHSGVDMACPAQPSKKLKPDCSRASVCVSSCSAAAQPSAARTASRIRIKVKAPTQYRETVFLTGGAPELGEWDVDRGIALQWTPGHIWHGQIELRSPQTEIKFVRRHEHQATANWQSGANIRTGRCGFESVGRGRARVCAL